MISVLFICLTLFFSDLPPKQEDSLRRVEMWRLLLDDNKEDYLKAAERLIDYHRKEGNEKYLYDAYATLFDRLQLWGRNGDAIKILERMSTEAQQSDSNLGRAVTAFCFGQHYLSDRLPEESEPYYRRAMQELADLGETGRAIRAGFNLQAIAMNKGTLQEGLAISDSTLRLTLLLENKAGKQLPLYRLKQTRYRFSLLWKMGAQEAAASLKDTLLHYASLVDDASQDELVQSAIAGYENKFGQHQVAYDMLDSLAVHFLRGSNFQKAAQYYRMLADIQKENGDLQPAVLNYQKYTALHDSVQVYQMTRQLNELTKRFEMNELRQENRLFRQRAVWATIIVLCLCLLLVIVFWYSRVLRRKNRDIFFSSNELFRMKARVERMIKRLPEEDMTVEEKLFKRAVLAMRDEHLYLDPDLTRDKFAFYLGTNRTILSATILKYTRGKTVRQFVNFYRLGYIVEKLSTDPSLAVVELGERAGFKSQTTYYRVFKEQFGIRPAEYRAIAMGRPASSPASSRLIEPGQEPGE